MTKYRQIRSVKNESNPKPWYGIQISNRQPEIVEDMDGSLDVDLTGATPKVPDHVDLPNPAQAAMSSDAIYAVTTDGEFIAYEPGTDLSDHGISLRAHLAWYDSATDEFEVLEFVES